MPPQRLNRSDQAYMHLTEEILRGRWQPGDTLSTYALAEELQISRTPVLEALKRLETEGLVEIIPQVGCRVIRPSSDAVGELFALRGALEGLAAEGAAKNMSDQDLREVRVVLERIEATTASGDERAYAELNYDFHMRIIEASRLPRVTHTAQGVWSLLRYQLARLPFMAEQMTASIPEHRAIYEALEKRSSKKARAAAERHSTDSGKRFVAQLEPTAEQPPAGSPPRGLRSASRSGAAA